MVRERGNLPWANEVKIQTFVHRLGYSLEHSQPLLKGRHIYELFLLVPDQAGTKATNFNIFKD